MTFQNEMGDKRCESSQELVICPRGGITVPTLTG